MRLYVIAGHGQGDPGACANGYSEAERVRALANKLVELGGGEVGCYDQSKDLYQQGGPWNLGIGLDVPCLELHQDSAGASAKGGHVIIKQGFSADAYDNALANFVSGFFPGRANSIVGRSDLQNINVAANVGQNYRLLECCFITNAADIEKFNAQLDEFAKGILECFGISTAPKTSPISEAGFQPIPTQAYTGKELYPELVPSDTTATYWTSYRDNVNVGWGTAIATGHDSWEGTAEVAFKILPAPLVSYADIEPTAWYVDAVRQAVERNVMSGYDHSTFDPDGALTRAQAVCAVYKAAGMVDDPLPYSDVEQAPWYHAALEWATAQGVASGDEGMFRPTDPCTREEFATMLHRWQGCPEAKAAEGCSEWAALAVGWASAEGVMDGTRPYDACTRAEAAAMVTRV